MRKQRKELPDLRSMIGNAAPDDGDAEEPRNQETAEPENQKTEEPQNQETKEPENQETTEPRNRRTKKPQNQKTKKPKNQGNGQAAKHRATDRSTVPHEPDARTRTERLPRVQVCVWIDPEVAGMIDTVRGALATRLPRRPTRSMLVEAILREGLSDPDALVDVLWRGPDDVTDPAGPD